MKAANDSGRNIINGVREQPRRVSIGADIRRCQTEVQASGQFDPEEVPAAEVQWTDGIAFSEVYQICIDGLHDARKPAIPQVTVDALTFSHCFLGGAKDVAAGLRARTREPREGGNTAGGSLGRI